MAIYLQSLLLCFEPINFILIVICSIAGIFFGAVPGLSGGLGISLLLPLTFKLDPVLGFCMLVSMWIGGVSGSFIGAVLLGIPGSASSIATCFDGYPMNLKGETNRALSLGIWSSFLGTFGSIIIATLLSPVIANLALKLGPWEYFSLCFCAITLVASLSKGSIYKGMLSAFLGIFIATIGMDPITASKRFTFGNMYLFSGIDMVALMLGLFAIMQIATDYASQNQFIPDVDIKNDKSKGASISDFTNNIGNMIRSFLIGLWIGFLPGMGSGLSNMIAYAQAKASSKHPENFGKGEPGGVIASEISNNASVGGALIPMTALGIPGDGTTALLLSGLMIHGLQPGPMFISQSPEIAYLIFSCVAVSALVVLALQLVFKRYFPMLLKVPYHYLYGTVLIMCFIGAFTSGNSMFTVGIMLVFSLLGIILKIADIPTSPLILSFILGPKLEEYFRKGVSYSEEGAITFLTRPVSALFLLVAVLSILWPYIKKFINANKTAKEV